MQENLFKILKRIVSNVSGAGAERIVDILYNKQRVNEFLISQKLSLTINQTRNILYRLVDEGLVEFERKKDKKKGGWYTYFWTMKIRKMLQRAQEEAEKDIQKLRMDLEDRKKDRYYYSKSIDVEYSEEEALQNNFICPETGEVLELRDTSKIQEDILKEIRKVEIVLEEINKELAIVDEKEKKISDKKKKEEEKMKEIEKKKKKAKRMREKKKLLGKGQKKMPEKKSKPHGKKKK